MDSTCQPSSTATLERPAEADRSGRPDVAMVFAAGLGTRMRPITDTIPKPLVRVAGRTLLDHMLDRFADAGVEHAVVNVHYRGEQIIDHLRGRERPRVTLSDEREKLLDQGGGIRKVLPALGEGAFFIANTDALWIEEGEGATESSPAQRGRGTMRSMVEGAGADPDARPSPLHRLRRSPSPVTTDGGGANPIAAASNSIALLRDAWNPDRMDVLLLLARREGAVGVDWPGDFFLGDDGRLARRGGAEEAPFVYAGVGIMKSSLFKPYTQDVFRLAPLFFDAAEQGRLHGLPLRGRWLHVGNPAAIGEAEEALAGTPT